MRIVAYLYSDPLLESAPEPALWGWEVEQVYHDLAMGPPVLKASGAKKEAPEGDRPQWQRLMHACEEQPIDGVLIRQLEDLGESVQEVSDRLAELEALQVQLIVAEPSGTDLPHAPGSEPAIIQGTDLKASLLQLLQQLQRNQRSRRIRQGHARNRVKAMPPPGKAPYGYRRGKNRYALDRSTAPIVKDFFEHFLLYGSVRGAVRYLAKKYGKKIAPSTGHRWLINPVYRGDLEYHNGQIVPDTHVPIISREEAAQVDRLLRRNRRLPPRTASAPRSLAGLVVCSECQSPTTTVRVSAPRQQREYLYLSPTACPKSPKCKSIAYDQILQQTIQRICDELPLAVAGVNTPDMDAIKAQLNGAIAQKQAVLEQLPPLIASGILDPDTADLRSYKLRTEIAELQGKLAQLPPVNLRAIAQAVSIPQFWLDLSESERRFYFREFIRHIELSRQGDEWQLKLVFIF